MIFIRTIDTKGKLKCITGTCLLHVNAISSVPGWYLPSENGQGRLFQVSSSLLPKRLSSRKKYKNTDRQPYLRHKKGHRNANPILSALPSSEYSGNRSIPSV